MYWLSRIVLLANATVLVVVFILAYDDGLSSANAGVWATVGLFFLTPLLTIVVIGIRDWRETHKLRPQVKMTEPGR